MEIKIKKLSPSAKLPTYATDGSACFDLYSTTVGFVRDAGLNIFGTGLAFEIPKGHVMLVFSRSGHGFKHGVRLANCTGVIDSDYRGEVMVALVSDREQTELAVFQGDRIAQAMILPVEQVQFVLSDELSETERGTGGFGSTGA
jgi:dUTP pyrophosphatase